MQYIWSHSGGTLPFLTSRFVELATAATRTRFPNGPLPIFQRFYYEVAQGNTPGQLAALMEMVKISQVMFGSDYPFRKGIEAVDGVHNYKFTPDEHQGDRQRERHPGDAGAARCSAECKGAWHCHLYARVGRRRECQGRPSRIDA